MLDSLFMGNKDGGITTSIIQAQQSGDPMVIIGLGGTGVDAISSLKRKLYKQIAPDNVEGVNSGEEPQYEHIRFLGIDADLRKLESSGLSSEEQLHLSIHMPPLAGGLSALKRRPEMQWMNIDYMSTHFPIGVVGTGGYRQYGRWLTIENACDIKTRLTQIIMQACTGRDSRRLNIHIITGVSGGMGGGSFADICYITKKSIEDLGFHSLIYGFFVLPDVFLSINSIQEDECKKHIIQRNGVAALMEIEHLMNLKESHECFEQDYGHFKIRTWEKLVYRCNFISSSKIRETIPNGYEYALNVIGDFILTFIAEQKRDVSRPEITMNMEFCNLEWNLSGMYPEHGRGYSQNYNIIGSVDAEIPTTEMVTYLASELFKEMKNTISKNVPDDSQIEQEFADYLKLSDGTFRNLERQMLWGASWIPVTEQLVDQYFAQIKNHMNDGILPGAMINPTEDSMKWRKALLIQKRESMEKNVESYVYEAGASSVPGLALNKLIEIIEDPKKGPIYAYGMMNKTGADIFYYLDGRKRYYASQRQAARDWEMYFLGEEPVAKKNLGNARIFRKKQAVRDYASVLYNKYKWQADADLYEEMEKLMSDLITVFRTINYQYLTPIYRITNELIETFDANSTYFQLGKGDQSQDGFTKQLVKFSDIKDELDDEIKKLNPEVETGGILEILTNYPEIWMESEEQKLKAKISEYMLEKFHPILSQSLEAFLRKDLHMENANDSNFSDTIQKEIFKPLIEAATPMFWTKEPMVNDESKTVHRTVLSVPYYETHMCYAAKQYRNINDICTDIIESFAGHRIHVAKAICGVPMYAYQGLTEYYDAYMSDSGFDFISMREMLTGEKY